MIAPSYPDVITRWIIRALIMNQTIIPPHSGNYSSEIIPVHQTDIIIR